MIILPAPTNSALNESAVPPPSLGNLERQRLPPNFLEYLRRIGKCPRAYKIEKVEDIHFLFLGFQRASPSLGSFLNEFRCFVETTLEMEIDEQITSAQAIQDIAENNEQALKLFFLLMEEFLTVNKFI